MYEIKFYGRGGQGVVMASQILGMAFFKAGMFPQCYSLFGGERRGAPVVSFLRVDKEKILLKCNIKHPNEILYFDPTLIDIDEIRAIIEPGNDILISSDDPSDFYSSLKDFRIGHINSMAVARKVGLGHVINTVTLGAYCRFTGHFSLEFLLKAIDEMVPSKSEANKEAARQGFEKVCIMSGET